MLPQLEAAVAGVFAVDTLLVLETVSEALL